MYYNDTEHKRKKQYTEDSIQWDTLDFKPQLVLKEEQYNPYQMIQLRKKPLYQEEEYYSREYGDVEFYKWLTTQNHKSVAILAEIVNAPKLDPFIENIRPQVKNMKTITIEEYRKIKCIGATKTEWLKQLKKKYGINILRFLYQML